MALIFLTGLVVDTQVKHLTNVKLELLYEVDRLKAENLALKAEKNARRRQYELNNPAK